MVSCYEGLSLPWERLQELCACNLSTMTPVGGGSVTVVRALLKWKLFAIPRSVTFCFSVTVKCMRLWQNCFLDQNYVH